MSDASDSDDARDANEAQDVSRPDDGLDRPPPDTPGPGRPPRRRIRQAPDRYGVLLLLIFVDYAVFFTSGLKGVGRAGPILLLGVTVLFGLRTSRVHGLVVWAVDILVGILVLLTMVGWVSSSDVVRGWAAMVGAVAVAVLSGAIMYRVLRHQSVTIQTIYGAVCVYVLFGFVFAFLEFGFADATNRQFFVQTANPQLADYLYFSFVTLTTLGFGDLTPANDGGRAAVSFEALLGQIFLVTLVARLVSLYGNPRRQAD